jgi:hypothetical protein
MDVTEGATDICAGHDAMIHFNKKTKSFYHLLITNLNGMEVLAEDGFVSVRDPSSEPWRYALMIDYKALEQLCQAMRDAQ